jgi:hypothetical protein
LDRDHRQESDGDQQKKAGEKAHFVGPIPTIWGAIAAVTTAVTACPES